MKFLLNVDALMSVHYAMETEDNTRPQLMGVHIKKEGDQLLYEATNGHLLIRYKSKFVGEAEAANLDIVLGYNLVFQIHAALPPKSNFRTREDRNVEASVDNGRIYISLPSGESISGKLFNNKQHPYPNTELVIPDYLDCRGFQDQFIGFDADYMWTIARSLNALFLKGHCKIFFGPEAESPHVFKCYYPDEDWLAVLMPLRVPNAAKTVGAA